MRKAGYIIVCSIAVLLNAEEEGALSEEAQISLLIDATKASLESLTDLKKCLSAFKEQEALCIKKPDDADALLSLSSKALALVSLIRENHVEPYFRSSFLEELDTIAKPARSKTLPPIISR